MKKKFLIIIANYYKDISIGLLSSAKRLIPNNSKFKVIEVPGVFEIPVTISKNIKKYDGFIALGCVIKGQTPHFDLICSSTFNSILKLSINFNKPIGNGVITALNFNQARQRSIKSNLKRPNKGSEAANAVISILNNEPKKI